jgi:monovalent cation:H+ antiporter-2, CPA2 family
MSGTTLVLVELGALFLGLGLLGRLASRAGMSPVPLYLLGGLGVGHGGLVPVTGLDGFDEIASELGVVLLLLMLGLEYTASELIAGLRSSWLAGVVDLLLNALPGAVLALLLGWGAAGAFVLGGVTYISSSGIAAKVLSDLGRLGNRETPVVLSILVFEDLAMAVYLPILTAVLAGASFWGGLRAVGVALLAVTLVLMLAVRFGPAISRALHSANRETLLLNIFGAALLVSGLTASLQVSAAVGAFLLGIAISGATANTAQKVLEPLRDLFSALFFVLFGINTDPGAIPPVLLPAVALAVVTTGTKLATGAWAAARVGVGRRGQLRAGAALVARGEFSIVIAGLAVASGAAPAGLAALASAYVMMLAVLGPVAARWIEPLFGHHPPVPSTARP